MTRARTISVPRRRRRAVVLLLLAIAVLGPARPVHALLPQANASGEALYQRECAPCHGPAGHGDGPEAPTFRTTPRDFGDLARADISPRIIERVRRSRLRMLEIDEDVVVERRQRMVEELVGYLQRMPDVPWSQVRRGADVYAERCEKCHGPNGRPVTVNVLQRGPQATGAQPRPDFQKAHGDAELLAIARGQGHATVAGFAPVMNEEDARALLAYLRLLSNGFVWYSLWCAGCHGDDGRADGPLATGIDHPDVEFSHVWLGAQSPDDLRRKAMHLFNETEPTAPHFARNISEGQARAVLAALRTIQAGEGPATPLPAGRATARAAAPPTPATTGAGAPALTPAPPSLERFLNEHGGSAAAPAGSAATAPATMPVASAAPAVAAPTAVAPVATPLATAARAPAATPTAAARRPGVQPTPPERAAAKVVKPTPAKPAVKPRPQVKMTVKPKPVVKPTPARKVAPRVTARPTPDHDVEPSRPAPEHVIEIPVH